MLLLVLLSDRHVGVPNGVNGGRRSSSESALELKLEDATSRDCDLLERSVVDGRLFLHRIQCFGAFQHLAANRRRNSDLLCVS